jgi:hypothetical protein
MEDDDIWMFGDIAFRRLVGGTDEPRWFPATLERTVSSIADSARRIIDRGATTFDTLSFVAWCDNATDAASLAALFGQERTLNSPTGSTSSALLVQADRLIADGAAERVQVTFEMVTA